MVTARSRLTNNKSKGLKAQSQGILQMGDDGSGALRAWTWYPCFYGGKWRPNRVFVVENVCWVNNFSTKLKESMRFSTSGFAYVASRLRRVSRAFSDGRFTFPVVFPYEGSHLQPDKIHVQSLHISSISLVKHSASCVFSVPLPTDLQNDLRFACCSEKPLEPRGVLRSRYIAVLP